MSDKYVNFKGRQDLEQQFLQVEQRQIYNLQCKTIFPLNLSRSSPLTRNGNHNNK